MSRAPLVALALLPTAAIALLGQTGRGSEVAVGNTEWKTYGADGWSTKYSPLAQIDAGNVDRLRIAWRWRSPENDLAA